MLAGIIAAGDGTRLRASHPTLIKPLVPVAGTPLCQWVVGSLRQAGVSDFTVLFNSKGISARNALTRAFPDINWSFLTADTASSWESFRMVCQSLSERTDRFVVSTVDALIPPGQIARFIREMAGRGLDAGLALTDFIDDEKPLWADLEPDGMISALGERARRRCAATAGLYYMTANLARRMPPAREYGSLRQYWSTLPTRGARLGGALLTKSIDVDRPQDIREAESFLKELRQVTPW